MRINKKLAYFLIVAVLISTNLTGCEKTKTENAQTKEKSVNTQETKEKKDNVKPCKDNSDDPNCQASNKKGTVTLAEALKTEDYGSNRLESVYNIDKFINKDRQIKTIDDIYALPNGNSAFKMSYTDLMLFKNHLANNYMAEKYNLNYTLQDVIDYAKDNLKKQKGYMQKPTDLPSLLDSNWAVVEAIGWEQYAMQLESDYINDTLKKKLIEEKLPKLTDDEKKEALNMYKQGVIDSGVSENEAERQSYELYITSKYFDDIYDNWDKSQIVANVKLYELINPETYKEVVKNSENMTLDEIQENSSTEDHE